MDDQLAPVEEHDRGLSHDLPILLSRRRALALLGGGGLAAALAACTPSNGSGGAAPGSTAAGPSTQTPSSSPESTSAGPAAMAAVAGSEVETSSDGTGAGEIPEETAGPFPADGSNGQNALSASGIVRRDIRSSFGSSRTTAPGVPLTIALTVVDVGRSGAARPVRGAAVYVWHCDRDGRYSMYDREIGDENYLRGVQQTDARGTARFTSIFPGCYSGRWPHVHFEVYPSVAAAQSTSKRLRTSQLALPKAVCETVYATSGYADSVANLARTSLAGDMVFADGYSRQLATVRGSVSGGYTATLRVPV